MPVHSSGREIDTDSERRTPVMAKARTAAVRAALALMFLWPFSAKAEDAFPYREGTYEKGELKYVDGLPLLVVQGTPEEMGRQQAGLTADAARDVLAYPRKLLSAIGREDRWPALVERSRRLKPQIAEEYLDELNAFAATAGLDPELLIAINTMVDAYRDGLGCSSLIVEPDRSETGGPLFGRNLDFFPVGVLQRLSLVVVYRPEGKHAFVSVGFPGMLGCFSGMNDAGLAVANHEVFLTRDGAPMFDPKGTPYTFCYRRILEECTTLEEAEKLLRSTPRTTLQSLAVCDRRSGGVLELTPRNVVLRRSERGIAACANHFRTEPLARFLVSPRYRILSGAHRLDKLGLDDVARKLDEVNLGRLTIQTMIFEPDPLVLHLAIGSPPTSRLPLVRLELAGLFRPAASAEARNPGLQPAR